MKLNYKVNQNDAGRFIGFLSLGVLYCLNNKMISIDEAEGFVFKPYVPRLLSEINASQELIDIIALGCELEDIESLAPEKLPANIDRLFEDLILFIKENKKNNKPIDKEIILTKE